MPAGCGARLAPNVSLILSNKKIWTAAAVATILLSLLLYRKSIGAEANSSGRQLMTSSTTGVAFGDSSVTSLTAVTLNFR